MIPARWFTIAVYLLLCHMLDRDARGQDPVARYRNTRPDVQYIGSDQCIECHNDQHASYLRTTHSVATVNTDPKVEPNGTKYKHPVLGIEYEVQRRDGRVVHREIVRNTSGQTVATTEKPIEYSVGSGEHAKSYLFRDRGFFGQSPLTWYQEPDAMRMSPGFEGPFQPSFHRKIDSECAFCHVGSIDPLQGNPYRFEIVETTIGCERCHGPGQLHAERYRKQREAKGNDDTIVNPAKLSRELSEAICQQCHLQGANWVTTSGHDVWDFRPSQPLTDVRVDYQFASGDGGMKIVGHVEQMHASECYQQTESLTCTTCHPPHNPVAKEDRADFYRRVCLDCHANDSCGKPIEERNRRADNRCAQCHMPKGETNVTHAAFHHHRIGIHADDPGVDGEAAGAKAELVPVLDLSGLSEREQKRCLSIAKVLQLRSDPSNPRYDHFGHEATEALIQLKTSGPTDLVSDSQLALLALAQNQVGIAEGVARGILARERRPTLARIEATGLLAKLSLQSGKLDEAARLYRWLTEHQRDAQDAFLLGICERRLGNDKAAIAALERALEIDPLISGPHAELQSIYQANDKPERAAFHAKAQRRVIQWKQQQQPR